MYKFEKKVIDYLQKNYLVVSIIVVTIMALLARNYFIKFQSNDYKSFLSNWFDIIKINGGLRALKDYPGDYNVPYMVILSLLTYIPIQKIFLIKSVSIIFDFGLAISSAELVKYLVKTHKKEKAFFTYAIVLFLPEVLLNSAAWSQCDAGYTLFVILSILFLLKEKYITSFIFLGIAFALKLQTVFILPLFITIYVINKKFSILHFIIIPTVNFLLSIPALIMGMPLNKILSIYINQVDSYKQSLSLNFLNIYSLIEQNHYFLSKVAVLLTIFACAFMLIYIIYQKAKLTDEKIINLAVWFVLITTFLLPRMHDRYMYMGGVLALIYFIAYGKNLYIVLFTISASLITYLAYLFGIDFSYRPIFVFTYLFALAYYTKDLLRMIKEE